MWATKHRNYGSERDPTKKTFFASGGTPDDHAIDFARNACLRLSEDLSHGEANRMRGLRIAVILSGANAISEVIIAEQTQ
jgi:hypothetical protein